ncbi:AraC family transcriptional regulator [Flavobacterium amniphilum]|uniref:AraC family transcriptional regulator n=1 Tax=Flavobacterium amniphilum TaxID=1834035 RepID=UPI00202A06D5|nr:AraC family transcriptional regulator [Flavobacterium amniphilum]MCL9807317.1 AraC family transcriptional regulator [Flavobacterium amniphilum]
MTIEKIQQILIFLENNYHRQIDPSELEEISNYSYRNIQRIFNSVLNETIGNFCVRLKLENAYKQLVYTNLPVVQIAYDVGYENNQSFSKAFKNKFQITPLQARENKTNLFEQYIKQKKEASFSIGFEYVFKEKTQIHYKTVISNNYNNTDINELWDDIHDENKSVKSYDCFGVIVDQPIISDETKSRYDACVNDCLNPKNYLSKTIFGQWYAKYMHIGCYDEIEETYRKIYHRWLYESNFELDTSPIIEHYIADRNSAAELITAIYVPVKRKLSK